MSNIPKRMTPGEFRELIQKLSAQTRQELLGRKLPSRDEQTAHCEDFFNKLDMLLPSHETSRREAQQLLARLCAGQPNLPQEGTL